MKYEYEVGYSPPLYEDNFLKKKQNLVQRPMILNSTF